MKDVNNESSNDALVSIDASGETVIDLRDEKVSVSDGKVSHGKERSAINPDAEVVGKAEVVDKNAEVAHEPAQVAQSVEPAQSVQAAPSTSAPSDQLPSRRRSLISLAIAVGGLVVLAYLGYLPATLVALGIPALIWFHELGHFLVAKATGMKATQFFIGFGPRLWSFRRGETEYGVRAIPLGGFVKVIGMTNTEEVDPIDEPRTYRQKPFWQQIAMAFAGPAANLVLAFVMIWALVAFVGVPTATTISNRIGGIAKLQGGSPAELSGLQPGDRIVAINGTKTDTWEQVQSSLRARPGATISLSVERNGASLPISLTLVDRRTARTPAGEVVDAQAPEATAGFVGISPTLGEATYETKSMFAAIPAAFDMTQNGLSSTINQYKKIFSADGVETYAKNVAGTLPASEQKAADEQRFVSPIGLFTYADSAARADNPWFYILQYFAAINVAVGLFNLIPLLPFDGGHIVVSAYGWLRSLRRPSRYVVDHRKLEPIMLAVVVLLIVISLTAAWLDVARPPRMY